METDIRIFLCGDVMLARGVDMVQEYSCHPQLHEGNSLNANDYVRRAEDCNGPLPPKEDRPMEYVWGDALDIWAKKNPDVRVINLETAMTISDAYCRYKSIHYRTHPGNVQLLKAAQIDCCVLSNNHTADWGLRGLAETIDTMERASIAYAGIGRTYKQCISPSVLPVTGKGRVLVYGAGHESSGTLHECLAKEDQCGLNVIKMSTKDVQDLAVRIKGDRKKNDIVVFSIHWGGNWGFEPEPRFIEYAHELIDKAGVDIVHGHSSHHVMGMEVYHGKLIMYGCGDFVNDYEGIGGEEEYRGDLALMYFVTISPSNGQLQQVCMVPTQMRQLQVRRPAEKDIEWLVSTMSQECGNLGTAIYRENNELFLRW